MVLIRQESKQIRDLLRMLCTEYDITIIVSSHILSEIESIADTIGVINRGVLVQEIAMQEITERSLAYIELNVVDTRKASYVLSDKIGIDNFKIVEDRIIEFMTGIYRCKNCQRRWHYTMWK